MEVSGAVIRQSVSFQRSGACLRSPLTGKGKGRARQKAGLALRRWSDESHAMYYASSPRCSSVRDTQRKELKTIAAFGTELSRELVALYSCGLGIDSEGLIGGEIRGEAIKEASELLLEQLHLRKAKEKEMKKRNKEEKAALKARKMSDCADKSSSSSSSESSDSECEEAVQAKKLMKNLMKVIPETQHVPDLLAKLNQEKQITENSELSAIPTLAIDRTSQAAAVTCSILKPLGKIEVCMGGKCTKSGSVELLRELEKKVGIEGAVVGCKCMGKCRQGPNVRVVSHGSCLMEKPLCIGVGLDDAGAIAAKLLGQNDGGVDMGLLAA